MKELSEAVVDETLFEEVLNQMRTVRNRSRGQQREEQRLIKFSGKAPPHGDSKTEKN
jgi:hypothetical protein